MPSSPMRPGLAYWLVATDNRDPDPQSTESNHQTFRLDRNANGINEQVDQKPPIDMIEAIRKAISEVEQREVADRSAFKRIERTRELTNEEESRAVENLKDRIEKTSSDLVAAADQHREDAFAGIAAKAKSISEKPHPRGVPTMSRRLSCTPTSFDRPARLTVKLAVETAGRSEKGAGRTAQAGLDTAGTERRSSRQA